MKKIEKKTSSEIEELKEQVRTLKRRLWTAERLRHDAVMKPGAPAAKSLDGVLLAAGVAHEFNNILGAADGHAEWALDSGQLEDMQDALRVVRQACARSLQITRSLQGMQSPQEEKAVIFDVKDLEQDLLKHFAPILRKKTLRFDLKLAHAKLYGNESRLFEVLVNLIKNAFEACEGLDDVRVSVSGQKKGARYVILVDDSGPGVSSFLSDKIFQPFFTTKGRMATLLNEGKASSELKPEGGGLGLFLSRSIVQQMGGSLRLAKISKGCRFQISLPAP